MITLINALKLTAGAILGGVVVYSYVQAFTLPAAREAERQAIRAETLERAIDLVQERSRTNADVQRLSDSDICIELGGLFRDGVCV
ncbi:hypothetical protein [Shinella sp. JR1-6]|uniref:hypothetical protein n=1 Tax=Shinella sp. JR1-6 TaxID=2527671 RepID=UPI00102D5CAF|nr:hypothetical protein [Shinella sp. JR1-6]TAA54797.1 hypothetical protein EXZ48_25855 [Shinella sp. JR1-6]